MRNSKLHSVLKEFDKYEQNRCRKYIQSPYFNRSEKIAELYDFFIEKINEGEEEDLSKESIWEVLHSKTKFNSDRWRKYCSDLLKLIEGYLIQEEFEKDRSIQDCYLMEAVKDRELNIISNAVIKKSEKNLKKVSFKNAAFFHNSYLLEKNKYNLIRFDKKRAAASNIDNIVRNLDIFYMSEKLRHYCNILSRQSAVSHEYEIKFIEEIVSHVSSGEYDNYPTVIIYYQIYLALNNPKEEKYYYKLKELLKKHAITFPQSEASDMYSFVINYCTRQLNSGNPIYWREYFEIYQQLLEDKIIIVNDELDAGIFKNIVATGLRIGEAEWTENFIHDYNKFLPDNQRENAVTYNSALLYFYQKKYDNVISLLQQVEYEDYIYNISSKQILLRTYYEMELTDPLFFLIDSFRAYLYRNPKISTQIKESYSNFLTITKKLARTNKRDAKTLNSLKEEINTKKNLASRSWIIEKIAEKE